MEGYKSSTSVVNVVVVLLNGRPNPTARIANLKRQFHLRLSLTASPTIKYKKVLFVNPPSTCPPSRLGGGMMKLEGSILGIPAGLSHFEAILLELRLAGQDVVGAQERAAGMLTGCMTGPNHTKLHYHTYHTYHT